MLEVLCQYLYYWLIYRINKENIPLVIMPTHLKLTQVPKVINNVLNVLGKPPGSYAEGFMSLLRRPSPAPTLGLGQVLKSPFSLPLSLPLSTSRDKLSIYSENLITQPKLKAMTKNFQHMILGVYPVH